MIEGFRELHLRPDEVVRAAAGEIDPDHLNDCLRCREEVSLLKAVNADLERSANPWSGRAWMSVLAVAAVLVIVVVVNRREPRAPEVVQETPRTPPASNAPVGSVVVKKAPTDFLEAETLVVRGAPDSRRAMLTELASALEPYRRDDFRAAESRLRALAVKFPDAPEVAYYLGVCLLLQNRPSEAVGPLFAATEAPGFAAVAEARVYLAVARLNGGDGSARADLEQLCSVVSAEMQAICPSLDRPSPR